MHVLPVCADGDVLEETNLHFVACAQASHSRVANQVRLSANDISPVQRQVAALQEWRAGLWRLCHGSLTSRGAPAAAALRPEPLAHAWLRLRKALQGLAAAAPAAAALPEGAPLRDAASRMDRSLGLDVGPPAKPYLWRVGGHPVPPPTHALCSAAARLAALAELTRARPSEWGPADPANPSPTWEPRPNPAARLAAVGIELPDGALQLTHAAEAMTEEVAARESPAAAAAAALSADWGLRQALLEGLGFFALAVQRLREGGALGSGAVEVPEREALEIVQLLEGRVQARAQEVRHPKGAHALQQGRNPALYGCSTFARRPPAKQLSQLPWRQKWTCMGPSAAPCPSELWLLACVCSEPAPPGAPGPCAAHAS